MACGWTGSKRRRTRPQNKFAVGDVIYAPYDGELYVAEILRLQNDTAKILFLEYDDYAERPLDQLVHVDLNLDVNHFHFSGGMNTNQQYDDDDFSASMKLGGGSSAGGGNGSSASVYRSKHVRAQLVRLSSTKKVKKKNKQ